jgi:hypothetical protein
MERGSRIGEAREVMLEERARAVRRIEDAGDDVPGPGDEQEDAEPERPRAERGSGRPASSACTSGMPATKSGATRPFVSMPSAAATAAPTSHADARRIGEEPLGRETADRDPAREQHV